MSAFSQGLDGGLGAIINVLDDKRKRTAQMQQYGDILGLKKKMGETDEGTGIGGVKMPDVPGAQVTDDGGMGIKQIIQELGPLAGMAIGVPV